MKTYTGLVLGAEDMGLYPRVRVRVQSGAVLELRASMRVAIEAITMIGRQVSFRVELSEDTQCLTDPKFVLGSQYGLRAVSAPGGAT